MVIPTPEFHQRAIVEYLLVVFDELLSVSAGKGLQFNQRAGPFFSLRGTGFINPYYNPIRKRHRHAEPCGLRMGGERDG